MVRITECDDGYLTLTLMNLVQPLTQLRHVLAAGESPEVTQEDEMDGAPSVQEIGQAERPAVGGREIEVGCLVTRLEHPEDSLSVVMHPPSQEPR
jgi:hypothetical protein